MSPLFLNTVIANIRACLQPIIHFRRCKNCSISARSTPPQRERHGQRRDWQLLRTQHRSGKPQAEYLLMRQLSVHPLVNYIGTQQGSVHILPVNVCR